MRRSNQPDKSRELYHEEVERLTQFRQRLDTHAIFKDDLDEFSNQYEELVSQAKVITRVSDRLQKKLDKANVQIKEQNVEIKDKNDQLQTTIEQLAQAKIGRRASAIMLTVALMLFVAEQVFLQDIIDEYIASIVPRQYTFIGSLGVLAILFFLVKFLESGLETYFMNQQKRRILAQEKNAEALRDTAATPTRPSLIVS